MSDGKQFNHEQLRAAKFTDAALRRLFGNVDLSQSKFNGANLLIYRLPTSTSKELKLANVNLANVTIDDANIGGLIIFG